MKKLRLKWVLIILLIIVIAGGSVAVYLKFGIKQNHDEHETHSKQQELWTCPMHPQVISDKPSVCPICNMDLVPKQSEEESESEDMTNMIKLSDNKLILANVSTIHVQETELKKQITAYSYLDFADQNRKVIPAKFNGRIEKLFVDKTGDYINAGQVLFEVYSPDLVQAQNDFLIALDSRNDMVTTLNSAKKKLLLFGFTSHQINELEKTKEVKLTVKYYSPISGIVIEKKVQEGMYFSEGTTLYDVADLSMLWNISEIYEQDLDVVKLGSKVRLKLQAYPGEIFDGKVSFIYPVVNSQTRTVKVRSEFANRSQRLKPQMFGETTFERNFGRGLVVPSDAILFMGKRNVVWLKAGDGMFEPKEVIVGMKINDKYQILSGLDEDDEIAITGGYLIDSESQLKSGMVTGHQHGETKKSTNKDEQKTQNTEEHNNKIKQSSNEDNSKIIRKGKIDVYEIDLNMDGYVYQDPMDWNVISDKPGICPLCGMDLKKVTTKEAIKNLKEHNFEIKE